jgi:phosphohistidine phosphatase SixA
MSKRLRHWDLPVAGLAVIWALLGVAVGEPLSKPALLARPCDSDAPRKLTEASGSARAMGEALRRLHIPIGQVLSSPTYRALETVRYAELGEAVSMPELGDGSASMQADPTGSRARWLRALAGKTPTPGTNILMITHFPNISEAFGASDAGLADGEALILQPVPLGDPTRTARIKIEEWNQLDAP